MKRQLKFKRYFFKDKECKEYSHFEKWGIDEENNSFNTGCLIDTNELAPYYTDAQYTNINDDYIDELYEYDIIEVPAHYEGSSWVMEYKAVILFEDGCYIFREISKYDGHLYESELNSCTVINLNLKKIGHIFEQKN